VTGPPAIDAFLHLAAGDATAAAAEGLNLQHVSAVPAAAAAAGLQQQQQQQAAAGSPDAGADLFGSARGRDRSASPRALTGRRDYLASAGRSQSPFSAEASRGAVSGSAYRSASPAHLRSLAAAGVGVGGIPSSSSSSSSLFGGYAYSGGQPQQQYLVAPPLYAGGAGAGGSACDATAPGSVLAAAGPSFRFGSGYTWGATTGAAGAAGRALRSPPPPPPATTAGAAATPARPYASAVPLGSEERGVDGGAAGGLRGRHLSHLSHSQAALEAALSPGLGRMHPSMGPRPVRP
jgi:hypothetical protein